MTRHRLRGMRAYLVGAMDKVDDGGIAWRNEVKKWLNSRGVLVFNPCDKPCESGLETKQDRQNRRELIKKGCYDEVISTNPTLRPTDLRMVDITDFIICNIDINIHACGTYEELSWANRQKKPIIIRCEQGKKYCPDWIFLMLKGAHRMIFDTWNDIYNYLDYIDTARMPDTMQRWMFFDMEKLEREANQNSPHLSWE